MTRLTIYFHECEHEGDLNVYVEACLAAGAQVVSSELERGYEDDGEWVEPEAGIVVVEVADKAAFVKAFSSSPSFGFSSLSR